MPKTAPASVWLSRETRVRAVRANGGADPHDGVIVVTRINGH